MKIRKMFSSEWKTHKRKEENKEKTHTPKAQITQLRKSSLRFFFQSFCLTFSFCDLIVVFGFCFSFQSLFVLIKR